MRLTAALIIVILAGLATVWWRPRGAQAATPKVGDQAPDFSTQAVIGDQTVPVHLIDYRGHRVVLYFYPKDNTPGCTKEACAFRDGYAKLQARGIALFGCSIDSSDSHRAFAKKYALPFPLLLDPGKKIATAYGAANGIPILGLDKRITYVIAEDGRIAAVYPEVDPSTHAGQIIGDLSASQPHPPALAPAASMAATPQPGDQDIE